MTSSARTARTRRTTYQADCLQCCPEQNRLGRPPAGPASDGGALMQPAAPQIKALLPTAKTVSDVVRRTVLAWVAFVAAGEAAVAGEPGDGALDHPTATAESLTRLDGFAGDADADVLAPQPFPQDRLIVGLVSVQWLGLEVPATMRLRESCRPGRHRRGDEELPHAAGPTPQPAASSGTCGGRSASRPRNRAADDARHTR